MKKLISILIFLAVGLLGFAQTDAELVRLGDNAFDKGSYASAAYFYNKVATGSNSGLIEYVFPYDLKHSNRVKEEKIDSIGFDSLAVDTNKILVHQVSIDSTTTNRDSTLSLNSKEIEMNYVVHRLAESYRLDFNYNKAEIWYEKAIKHPSEEFPLARYYYGNSLMSNEKYEKANDQFLTFITNAPRDGELGKYRKLAKAHVKSCKYALSQNKIAKGVDVKMCDSTLNIGKSATAPAYYGHESAIVFSAAGVEMKDEKGKSSVNHDYDMYITTLNEDGYDSPDKLPMPLNSEFNESSVAVTEDTYRIYFTKWEGDECAIYGCNNFQGKWLEPFKLNEIVNSPGAKSMHPKLSMDGKHLYFSSNREGGKGGFDIWVCHLDDWGNPDSTEHLGPDINTKGDEIAPFLHPSGEKLYFSSNYHPGFGGFDIFYSQYTEETSWIKPQNMGKPYNSSRDDHYFITDYNGKKGFFASDRQSCDECLHGNCMKLYEFEKGPPQFFLDGIVFDAETGVELANATVSIMDVKKHEVVLELTTDETGYYSTPLDINKIYFIKGLKYMYFRDATSVTTLGLTESQSFMRDLYLAPIPDEEIDIPGIEYDYDKATLRPVSIDILNELYDFLELNSNLVIEIRSHTDIRGSDEYNMKLSQARAKSCVDYLISRGVDPKRLIPVGFGESEPKVPNAQTEEEHQRNRRTAFNVVSQTFEE